MKLEGSVVLVTGSNRGLGRALVDDLLGRGVARIYAGSRTLSAHPDPRVVALRLDVTDHAQVHAAAAAAPDVELLINNAGVASSLSVLQSDPAHLRRDLDVNLHGMLDMVRAFLPVLAARRGAIVNILSVVSLSNMPLLGGYCATKAAAWSLTQALRVELRKKGIRVHAAFPGLIDTDMARGLDLPKSPASVVARGILDGVAADQEDIATDPMSAEVLATWLRDPRELERRFADLKNGPGAPGSE